jgi:hypothetical protein
MYYDAPICWRERHDARSDEQSGHLFSYLSPEQRVPVVHPLRTIRAMTDDVLRRMPPRFDAIYAATGRPSIPPEHLLRTLLLQVLYSVRSERMLMEQLDTTCCFAGSSASGWMTTCGCRRWQRNEAVQRDVRRRW